MMAKTVGSTPRKTPSGYHWAATLHTTSWLSSLSVGVERTRLGEGSGEPATQERTGLGEGSGEPATQERTGLGEVSGEPATQERTGLGEGSEEPVIQERAGICRTLET